jgi:hypothetical protein
VHGISRWRDAERNITAPLTITNPSSAKPSLLYTGVSAGENMGASVPAPFKYSVSLWLEWMKHIKNSQPTIFGADNEGTISE